MKTKAPLRFEYWKSVKNKQWYWRIRAGNSEPIAQGEGYKRKAGVLKVFHILFDFEAKPVLSDVSLQEAGFKVALDKYPLRFGKKPKPKHFEGKLSRNFP